MHQEISISIPWFLQPLIKYIDIVWSYCLIGYTNVTIWCDGTIETIRAIGSYSTTTNVVVPFLAILLFFWPLFVSIGMAILYAWAWIFWIVTSMVLGSLQVIYAAYQFLMISLDLLGLSMLKAYNMTRHTALFYLEAVATSSTVSKITRIRSYDTINTKIGQAKGISTAAITIQERQYYVKKNRRIWKEMLEKAGCYENFLKIRIEPKDLTTVMKEIEFKLKHNDYDQSKLSTTTNSHNNNNSSGNNNNKNCIRDSALPPLQRSGTGATNDNDVQEQLYRGNAYKNNNNSTPTVTNMIMRRVHSFSCNNNKDNNNNNNNNNRDSGVTAPRRSLSFSLGDKSPLDKHLLNTNNSNDNNNSNNEDLKIDPVIQHELGDNIANLLTSTMIRLREARIRAMNAADVMITNRFQQQQQQQNMDKDAYMKASSALQYMLSAVVKRNHLTLEDIVVENARSVAETGRYGLSNQSRHLVRAYYEEVQKALDYIADSPLLSDVGSSSTTTTNNNSISKSFYPRPSSPTTVTATSNNQNNSQKYDTTNDDSSDNSPVEMTQTPPISYFATTTTTTTTTTQLDASLKFDKSPMRRRSNNNSYSNLATVGVGGEGNGNGSISSCQTSNKMKQQIELNDRITLIRKMKHNIGRTALMFSGGGAQAMYHLGVIRALIESRLYDDISVISGTSGGSIVAAMCAMKTADELYNDVCVPTVSTDFRRDGTMKELNIRWFPRMIDMITYWMKHRLVVDSVEFGRTCEYYYNDTTFEEAFQHSGKHVCITVSASRASGNTAQRLLLNHISTPNVTIASAVRASCALPGVMAPAKLMVKNSDGVLEPFEVDGVEWIDGSVQADLPFQRIATLFAVTSFIVSQTNFHIVPFINKNHHPGHNTLYWRLFQTLEWDIRNRALKLSRLGLFPTIFGQDISNVFKQKYHGNLTIVPRFTAMQTIGMKILSNPTVKDMEGYLKYSQIAVWPYLNAIRDMIRLEKSLDDCLSRLESRMRVVAGGDVDLFANNYNDDVESIASSYVATSSSYGAGALGMSHIHGTSSRINNIHHHDYHHQNSSGSIRSVRISGLATVSNDFGVSTSGYYNPNSGNNNNNNNRYYNNNNEKVQVETVQLRERVCNLENENQELRLALERLKGEMKNTNDEKEE